MEVNAARKVWGWEAIRAIAQELKATRGESAIDDLLDAATAAVEMLEADVRESVPRERWDDVLAGLLAFFVESHIQVAQDPEAMHVGLLLRKMNPRGAGRVH